MSEDTTSLAVRRQAKSLQEEKKCVSAYSCDCTFVKYKISMLHNDDDDDNQY